MKTSLIKKNDGCSFEGMFGCSRHFYVVLRPWEWLFLPTFETPAKKCEKKTTTPPRLKGLLRSWGRRNIWRFGRPKKTRTTLFEPNWWKPSGQMFEPHRFPPKIWKCKPWLNGEETWSYIWPVGYIYNIVSKMKASLYQLVQEFFYQQYRPTRLCI